MRNIGPWDALSLNKIEKSPLILLKKTLKNGSNQEKVHQNALNLYGISC